MCVCLYVCVSSLRLKWTCTRTCVITCSLRLLHMGGPCTWWGNLSVDCATLPAPARKHSNIRCLWNVFGFFLSTHPISHLPAEVEIHRHENSFYLYPDCIQIAYCVSCMFLGFFFFTFLFPLLLFSTAVHQPQAPVCLSPWQWRRIIVVAVTSWPSVDTSWTGTSSRFTLSTLPAMMLWVIWQPANEHSEVLWPFFLSRKKEGLCEWGSAWGQYFHPSVSFQY